MKHRLLFTALAVTSFVYFNACSGSSEQLSNEEEEELETIMERDRERMDSMRRATQTQLNAAKEE